MSPHQRFWLWVWVALFDFPVLCITVVALVRS